MNLKWKINMELLFAFEIEKILWFFCKINFIDLALLYSFQIEKPFARKYFSGKLIWSSYICSILIGFLTNFSFFGKLIWIYYSKPKLVPWGALFGQRCQLCETLMKRKVWGSFFGAQGAHFCDLGRKKAPSDLTFYKVWAKVAALDAPGPKKLNLDNK